MNWAKCSIRRSRKDPFLSVRSELDRFVSVALLVGFFPEDCAPDGKCITLDNSSHDRDVDVSNWVLKRVVDGASELSYTIPYGLAIPRGGELKIFARSAQNAHHRPPYQVVNDKLDSWGMGTECITKLYNDQGEEKASHEQKIVFGSDSARTIP